MEQCSSKKPLLDRYVGYAGSLYYGDKVVKAAGYSFSTLAAVLRLVNGGHSNHITEGLDRFYGEVSMARVAYRIFGTTDALEALKNDSWAGDWKDPRIKKLARLEALAMVVYHPMEHVGWAAYIAPKLARVDGDWWFARACWFWVIFVVADLYSNSIKLKELREREGDLRHRIGEGGDESEAAKKQLADVLKLRKYVVYQQWRMAFFLPNAIHWSFYKPPFPKGLVAILGLAEALIGIRQTFPKA